MAYIQKSNGKMAGSTKGGARSRGGSGKVDKRPGTKLKGSSKSSNPTGKRLSQASSIVDRNVNANHKNWRDGLGAVKVATIMESAARTKHATAMKKLRG